MGTVFEGKYKIESKLGEGGMGVVYKATHIFMERAVAIKFLHGDRVKDTSTLDRFKREAMAAGRLQHPNATAVIDFGVSNENTFYLVMEYLNGRTLRERLQVDKSLSYEETARILYQVCGAVEAAHKRNIIHRDLKPDNIFLQMEDDREVVKVIDFGIAKITHSGEVTQGLTEAGMIVGTPFYMSPEQCQSDNLDTRADIYSIGVIIYEMLTGHVPFRADTAFAIALKHVGEPVPSPRETLPDMPVEVEAVILKSLEKNRLKRHQTALELADDFAKAIDYKGWVPSYITDAGPSNRSTSDGNDTGVLKGRTTGENKGTGAKTPDSPAPGVGRETSEISQVATQIGKRSNNKDQSKRKGRETGEFDLNKENNKKSGGDNKQGTLAINSPEDSVGTLALGSLKVPKTPEEVTTTQPTPPAKSPMALYAGVGIVVLLVAVVVAVKLLGGGGTPTSNTTPTPGLSPTPVATSTAANTNTSGVMIAIEGGSFKLGRDEGNDQFGNPIPPEETPANLVTVKPFYIAKYELTSREYAEFLQATGTKPPLNWKPGNEGAADLPVTGLDWNDANEYCKWRAKKEGKPYRLPTEEEWEFAARGSENRLYPWGAIWEPGIANTRELTGGTGTMLSVISQTLTKDVSPFGVIAMAGNASEWTASDAKLYPGNEAELEKGLKIAKGGNYGSGKATSAATFRLLNPPNFRDVHVGVRLAMDKTN